MQRYLLGVSYMGTFYRGITKIDQYYKFGDPRLVQGCLEKVIKSVLGQCEVRCASRTDAKVHGLSTYFQVDHHDQNIDVDTLRSNLNAKLIHFETGIRINSIEMVNNTRFEAFRNVFSRSYLYRMAVRKTNTDESRLPINEVSFPIEEVDRCYFLRSKSFDIDKFEEAAAMLVGKHDFRTFMQHSKDERAQITNHTWRNMLSVSVEKGRPAVTSYNAAICDKYFQFYDVHFTARSYVYRQIRRLIGALCAVGTDNITMREFYEMLTIPSHATWDNMERNNLVSLAPGCGLYLHSIIYKSEEEWIEEVDLLNPRGVAIRSFLEDREYRLR